MKKIKQVFDYILQTKHFKKILILLIVVAFIAGYFTTTIVIKTKFFEVKKEKIDIKDFRK